MLAASQALNIFSLSASQAAHISLSLSLSSKVLAEFGVEGWVVKYLTNIKQAHTHTSYLNSLHL